MEEEYTGYCDVCDAKIRIIITDDDQRPTICPMCGFDDVEYENTSEE